MSLYVDSENQKLLWNIINTNPYLTNIFAKYHPSQKANWFKSVIEHFYNQYKERTITELELHQMNKDTLAYMIQLTQQIPPLGDNHLESANMSPIVQPNIGATGGANNQYAPAPMQQQYQAAPPLPPQLPQYQPQPPLPPPPPQYQNQYNPVMNSQQQQQQYNIQQPMAAQPSQTQFYSPPMQQQKQQPSPQFQPYPEYRKQPAQQQQEYQPMFDRKKPEPIDFSEKIEDGVITNMDDLIQKHMREREQELKLVAATQQQQMMQPGQLGQPSQPPPPPPRREMREGNDTNENIKAAVIEPIVSEVNNNNNNMEVLSAQVLELKDIILLLRQEVKGLREKMEEKVEEKAEII